ncbi:MAG TPA: hypothetical protein VNL18_08285 [Gemmatimonadales bacterium]|nr:hypothetical protein [Gemmatimonadales bacterium]
MPRTGRPFTRGILASALLHAAVLALVLWQSRLAWLDAARRASTPGGGGGASVTYIELPAFRATAPPQPEPRRAELSIPVVVVPEPVVEPEPVSLTPVAIASTPVGVPPPGAGAGAGPGAGGGVGSGAGTGVGPDVGSGSGPGGTGDVVFPPEPKYSILPPLPKPASVRGQTYRVRFWVDASGRVTMVDVTPRIPDGEYRKKFLDLMRQYTFTPARRADGTPVRGETVVVITL